MGTAPFIGGGFGHFYQYAPEKYKYPIDRYAMETKRIFSVANLRLGETRYLAGDELQHCRYCRLSVAGEPLARGLQRLRQVPFAARDTSMSGAGCANIDARPGVIRGRLVNTKALPERHSAADFDSVEDRSLFDPVRQRADV